MHTAISSLVRRLLFVLLFALLGGAASAQLPPRRSTVFDGSAAAQVRFPAAVYAPSNSLTLEAWVRRDDENRCETIVAQNFTTSFWFGFCGNRLRFYRQGGSAVDATANVPAQRWTHVAVVFDPSVPAASNSLAFYIDGVAAGTGNPRPVTTPLSLPLYLGANPAGLGGIGGTYPFLGALDEVRIWSVARTAGQIRTNRFRELDAEPGLVAVFPGGGTNEPVSGRNAVQVTGAVPQIPGILPRDLVVPRQRSPIAFDGLVQDNAYDDAEALVVRYPYGSEDRDLTARLVVAPSTTSASFSLYIAIPRIHSSSSATVLNTRPEWRVYSDFVRGDGTAPNSNDVRFAVDAYETGALTSAKGNGAGGFTGTNAVPSVFEARIESGVEFDAPSMELRFIPGAVIPSSSVFPAKGFLMDLFEPFRSILQPGFTRSAPFDAFAGDTTTWPAVSMGTTVGTAASIDVNFKVVNPDRTNALLAGAHVSVWDAVNRTLVARGVSSASGSARLSAYVPTNTPLQFRLELPSNWKFADPARAAGGSPAPTAVAVATIDFPGCPTAACGYPEVTFFALDPPAEGATASFVDVEPNLSSPAMLVRETPAQFLPAGTVAVRGEHFDRTTRLWTALDTGGCSFAPTTGDPDPSDDFPACEWQRIEPTSRTQIELQFQIPYTNRPNRTIRVWLQDGWSGRWLTSGDGRVSLVEPPYPRIRGFSFENYGDGHDIDDYRAAFPGVVCDPFKMVGFWAFFPIYLDLLNDGGECVGMVTSANFFRLGSNPGDFVRGVLYTAGFTADDNRVPNFDVGNVCAPRPTSLRAVIRSNHGVQTSSQFLGDVLRQLHFGLSGGFSGDVGEFGGSGYGFYTPMGDRLNEIRAGPLSRVICIKPDLLGTGHALQPLGVRDGEAAYIQLVDVYDPNHPGETRVLRVNTRADRFSYDGFRSPWRGGYLFVHDVRALWTHGRDIISIDTLGAAIDHFGARGLIDLLGMLVSGSAEPLLTFPDGKAWGWRPDRSTVTTATNLAEVPNFGQLPVPASPLGHGPAQVFFNPHPALPAIDLHARGDRYSFQIAQGGQLFQVLASGRRDGDRDRVRLFAGAEFLGPGRTGSTTLPAAEALQGFLFQPGRAGAPFQPRIALGRGGSNTLALFTWSGLANLPADAAVRFGVDPERAGALFVNDTGVALSPNLEILTPPLTGTALLSNSVPLPVVPPGAAVGSYLLGLTPGQTPRIQFELDRDRDRRPEARWIVAPDAPLPTGAPVIRARLEGDQVVLIWPLLPSAWWLAGAEDVEGPWKPVLATLALAGDETRATLPTAGTERRFFRLVQGTPP